MKKVLGILFYLIFAAIQIILLYQLSIPYQDTLSPYSYFVPFLFPIAFFLNVLLFLFLLWKKKYLTLIPFISIILCWNLAGRYIQIRLFHEKAPDDAIHFISYNVRNFDVYNYNKDWSFNTTIRDKIIDLIAAESPDIICFQEYFYEKSGEFKTREPVLKAINGNHHYERFTKSSKKRNYFGLAIFSTYPIVNQGFIELYSKKGNQCIYVDVVKEKDTIRVYNFHLESIGLSNDDFLFRDDMSEAKPLRPAKVSDKIPLRKMMHAAYVRIKQAKIINTHIKKSPYPVIACGDLNDIASSATYKLTRGKLNDSFTKAGSGFGFTHLSLPLRIDYVFPDKSFRVFRHKVIKQKLSDHYPVSVRLSLER